MPTHTLYACVDGYDLAQAESQLVGEFNRLLHDRSWSRPTVLVNERSLADPKGKRGDLPPWALGIQHDLPEPGAEGPGWFEDVEAIARFLGDLVERTGRNFVIGIADNRTFVTNDILLVSTPRVNLSRLAAALGA